MLELNDKVNIILVLLLFIVLFHILFFVKPEWFKVEVTCECCRRKNCPCLRQGCPCMKMEIDD